MLYIPAYLIAFFSTNGLYEPSIIVHHPLDDVIPFVVEFVTVYMLWFPAIMLVLLIVMILSEKDFKQMAFVMFTGMTISLIIYAIIPTGLDLRPEVEVNGFCSWLINTVWSNDVPMNVCPSIHVSSSMAVFFVVWRGELFKKHPILKSIIMLFMVAICISTVFVKQHSVVDVFFGCLLTVILYVISEIYILFRRNRKTTCQKTEMS